MWRFFKDFMIYGFASVLGKIVAIFLMPMYTSILTKEEYGAMALITSCYGLIDLFANLNIHSGIARDYYEEGINRKMLVSTGIFSILGISFLVMLILLFTRLFWFSNVLSLDHKYLLPFTVMLCTIPVTSLHTYFAVLTRYKKKAVLFSIGSIISLIITISITIYGVVILRAGIVSVFIATFISGLISTLYFAYLNRSLISIIFCRKYLIRALKFSIPALPAILAGWADNSIGQILIGKYASLNVLGVYSIALSFCSVFTLITTAFMNVWSPFLYENYKKTEFANIIKKLFILLTFALIIISVTLSLFSKEIVLLLTNPSYMDACKYLTLLCIPMCFYLLFPMASSGISISRNTKYLGISYILGSVINLCTLFFTIERWGVIALPICLSLSRTFTYFYMYSISKKKVDYHLPNELIIVLITSILGCYFLIDMHLNILIRFLLVLIIYIIIYLYLKKLINVKSFFCKLSAR